MTSARRHKVQEEIRGYERSPRDALRLVGFAVAALLLFGLTRWASDAITGLEQDLLRLVGFLNAPVTRVLAGIDTMLILVIALLAIVLPLVTRRFRLFWYLVAGSVASGVLMRLLGWWLDSRLPDLVNEIGRRAHIDAATAPTTASAAQLAALCIIIGPFVSDRWKRAGSISLTTVVVLQLVVSPKLPVDLFVGLALGAMVGCGVLLAFGRPDRRPTIAAVRAALVGSGVPIAALQRAKVDARGSTPYFATLEDGTGVFVKVLGEEERAADLLFRIYRYLRLRDVGDERPFSSLRRTIEHEALVALHARNVGVRTPRIRAVVDVGTDSMLLAQDMIDGSSIDSVPPGRLTDDVLAAIWGQVALFRTNRIAHRDLRRANVFLDNDDQPWMIDFGFSELAASDVLLNADVAQLVASLAVAVGPERAVASGIASLGADAMADALPRMQMGVLSGATQDALKEQGDLLKRVQQEVMDQCGISDVHYESLQRVDKKMVFTAVMLAAVFYFLLPQFADLPGVFRQIREANWAWFPPMLVVSLVTYVGAGVSLAGGVPDRLRAGRTFVAQLASSFASKLAPAGIGGMALNVRFLQKSGVDQAVAVTGISLNTAGGFVVHLLMTLVFIVWAGSEAFKGFSLPDPKWFLVGAGVVAVLAIVSFAVPSTRRLLKEKVLPIFGRAVNGVNQVIHRPGKIAMLFGGSAIVTLSYLVCLYLATLAFGGALPFATVGAVYLAGAAVAMAAPTPGGLGAMEAALIAGLVAAGMSNTIAIPAVFLYRFATFWLPILPGWGSFAWLKRRDYI